MTYDKEFEDYWGTFTVNNGLKKGSAYIVWKAARKDYYRIGEEVESITNRRPAKIRAVVDWDSGCLYELNSDDVRRVPAWTPKEGEAVLFENTFSYAECGLVIKVANCFVTVKTSNGTVFGDDAKYLRSFSADKIGKPWEEI